MGAGPHTEQILNINKGKAKRVGSHNINKVTKWSELHSIIRDRVRENQPYVGEIDFEIRGPTANSG